MSHRPSSVLLMLACIALASCGQRILKKQTATAMFQDVASAGRWDDSGKVVKTYPSKAAVPEYLFDRGQLRLLIQTSQQGVFVTYVDQPDWNRRRLVELRTKHPELGLYLSQAKWPTVR